AATSSLDLAAVLGELLQKIDRFLPYLAVTVQLLDGGTGRMEPAACRNIDEKDWRAHFDADGGDESPALGVAPLIVRNSGTDPRTSASAFLRRHALLSFAQLPLVAKGEVLGIITFYKREEH